MTLAVLNQSLPTTPLAATRARFERVRLLGRLANRHEAETMARAPAGIIRELGRDAFDHAAALGLSTAAAFFRRVWKERELPRSLTATAAELVELHAVHALRAVAQTRGLEGLAALITLAGDTVAPSLPTLEVLAARLGLDPRSMTWRAMVETTLSLLDRRGGVPPATWIGADGVSFVTEALAAHGYGSVRVPETFEWVELVEGHLGVGTTEVPLFTDGKRTVRPYFMTRGAVLSERLFVGRGYAVVLYGVLMDGSNYRGYGDTAVFLPGTFHTLRSVGEHPALFLLIDEGTVETGFGNTDHGARLAAASGIEPPAVAALFGTRPPAEWKKIMGTFLRPFLNPTPMF